MSQLDTIETVSAPPLQSVSPLFFEQSQVGKGAANGLNNDTAIAMGGKNVGEAGGAAQTMHFGFTNAAMKTTLFSRMSPSAVHKNGGGNNFAETQKIMRTQGSSNNVGGGPSAIGGTTNNAGSSMTSPTAARTVQMPLSGVNARAMKSPFRDAM